ncbi:NAD(P)/FAD-dependent oxidoreductase [Mycobacterium sp. TY814]|uniref:flavin-containing monooxygenase n=1 Tax=unclassified Mycobacterium TaxID=2642494 RepID=UPI00274277CD|nr:FAD-dependent oxidoreductase [Mycobacterium sp. TY814]MDP7721662.1 NAD(P)-binding domain-containing protein [Mycobacterium sp. TY814]
MPDSVAVIGAGPGGLVAARWLLAHGFEVALFEQAPTLGGQWAGLEGSSGVWPAMHTNSSRVLTAFSDLPPEVATAYPSNRDILAYLCRYADMFGITPRIRLGTRVDLLRRTGNAWLLSHSGTREKFERVVLAPGRFHTPAIPKVPGLQQFSGQLGATSTYHYRGPAPYRGRRVLVAGGAISALDVATDLARGGAHVTVTQRRQRYVLPKFVGDVPSDHRMFTRYHALAGESLPATEFDCQLKQFVVGAGGNPADFGAPAPHPSLATAGVTLNDGFLPLVAEGRITVRPWMKSVHGSRVTFSDGHDGQFDALVFGTGYQLSLPLLDARTRALLNVGATHFDSDRHTFHPDLPGLAFVGLWDQSGGYFVPLELQARWIAYTWSGAISAPAESDQRRSIEASRGSQKARMDRVALTFARAAGVEPQPDHWPQLRRALLFGPLAPSCFRLEGPDARADAARHFTRDAAEFGAITSNELTELERSRWSRLAPAG